MTQLALFNYDHLEEDISFQVRLKTQEIQNDLSVTATHVVRIGERLSQVKALLGHGHFGAWLDHEFGWSERSARNYISVYEVFKSENIADLGIATSALYLLASPSTPEEARTEALDIARSGETITPSRAKEIIEAHKEPVVVEIGSTDEDNLLDWAKPVDYFPEPEDDDTETVTVSVQRSSYEPKSEVKLNVEDFTPAKVNGKLTLVPKSALAETDGQSSASMRSPERTTTPQDDEPGAKDEWYTPSFYIELVREVFGGEIDIDPASCYAANAVVKAKHFYTKEEDGLSLPLFGKVFCNPPYSKPSPFVQNVVSGYTEGEIEAAILLLNSNTDTDWFHFAFENATLTCFTDGRITFWRSDSKNGQANRVGQVIFYFGNDPDLFHEKFINVGIFAQCKKQNL